MYLFRHLPFPPFSRSLSPGNHHHRWRCIHPRFLLRVAWHQRLLQIVCERKGSARNSCIGWMLSTERSADLCPTLRFVKCTTVQPPRMRPRAHGWSALAPACSAPPLQPSPLPSLSLSFPLHLPPTRDGTVFGHWQHPHQSMLPHADVHPLLIVLCAVCCVLCAVCCAGGDQP